MKNYVVVTVPEDLLPQVVGELLQFTSDPNRVDVIHGAVGRVVHVDPLVAQAWLAAREPAAPAAPVAPVAPVAPAAPATTPLATSTKTVKK